MKPSLHFTLDGLVRALRLRAHGIAADLDLSRGLMDVRPGLSDVDAPRPRDQPRGRRRRGDDGGRD
jgi:hypothetical protein